MNDMPQRVPARGHARDLPTDAVEKFAGSAVTGIATGSEGVTVTLADGRQGTYRLELSPGGGGVWVLES